MDPLQPGDPGQVGAFRLLGRLGEGGMGQVFLGRSPGGRQVAVKLIRPEHADRDAFRIRFAREVEAAKRVGGFHTAPVVDADPDADPPWMVTAYIPGPSLAEVVTDHGPLPVGELRVLAAGLAEGLAAIHACELVHRDLKPANIIMAGDGPRIIDFGIARPLDTGTITGRGAILGSWPYMSPEHLSEENVVPASDIFSLGAVLAFAATGRSPFDAPSIALIARRIVEEPPHLDQVPASVREVIAACLAKHPDDRPSPQTLLTRITAPDVPGHHPWTPRPARNITAPVHDTGASGDAPTAPPPSPIPRPPGDPSHNDLGLTFEHRARRPLIIWALLAVVALCISGFLLRQTADSYSTYRACTGDEYVQSQSPGQVDYCKDLRVYSTLKTRALRSGVGLGCTVTFAGIAVWQSRRIHRRMTITPLGVEVKVGRHTHRYQWTELTKVGHHGQRLRVLPKPTTPLPPPRPRRAYRPHTDPRTGWIVVSNLKGFGSSPSVIAQALAQYSGTLWQGQLQATPSA